MRNVGWMIAGSIVIALSGYALPGHAQSTVTIPPGQRAGGVPGGPLGGLNARYYDFGSSISGITSLAQANQLVASSTGPNATFTTTAICFPDCSGSVVYDSSPLTTLLNGHDSNLVYTSPNGQQITSTIDHAVMILSGYIAIAHAGDYVFHLGSDDGSILKIGGQTVVDNDNVHAFTDIVGTASFSAPGLYPIAVEYFENTDRTALDLWGIDSSTGNCFIGRNAACQGVQATTVFYSVSSGETILYNFTGSATSASADGAWPSAQMVADKSGALYGTTLAGGANLCNLSATAMQSCGTLFKLTPPASAGGAWTETVLYNFQQKHGWAPQGRLRIDDGTIYGTTLYGGHGCGPTGCGTVYAVTPSAIAGATTETVLHAFDAAADGRNPNPRLLRDAMGALYGSARQGGVKNKGVVFQLTPPASAGAPWGYSTLYRFSGAADGGTPNDITIDSTGAIYGTTVTGGTHGRGVAYRLAPPAVAGGTWTLAVLYDFAGGHDGANPQSGMILDEAGTLYGTTLAGGGRGCCGKGCGTVFALAPNGGGWSETVLHSFKDQPDGAAPTANLIGTAPGPVLYGTTTGGGTGSGTVFSLTPPSGGNGKWTEAILAGFFGTPDGAVPDAGLYRDATGALYGTTQGGGANGVGAVYQITP